MSRPIVWVISAMSRSLLSNWYCFHCFHPFIHNFHSHTSLSFFAFCSKDCHFNSRHFLGGFSQRLLSHLSIVRDHCCCLGRQLVRLDREHSEHRFVQKSDMIYLSQYGNFNGKDSGNAQTNCGYPMFKPNPSYHGISWLWRSYTSGTGWNIRLQTLG